MDICHHEVSWRNVLLFRNAGVLCYYFEIDLRLPTSYLFLTLIFSRGDGLLYFFLILFYMSKHFYAFQYFTYE